MGDTVITIIAIFLAAVLMFVFPLLAISERNDDITQLAVQTATSEFVDEIAIKGVITESRYSAFAQTLGATGNTYDIEIEVQHLDENPGKKSSIVAPDLIGENVRYSTFTTDILNSFSSEKKSYPLKKGDNVIVSVKNTNQTIAQIFRTFMYKVTGNNTYQVGASYSSMVVNSGN